MSEVAQRNSRRQRILREAVTLGLIVVGILAARSTFADHYYVPSGSMEYTLIAGDRVFVDKRAYGIRIPFTKIALTSGASVARGDIVIFDSPKDGKRLIKRIVAVGGDQVLIRDGHLAINGEWLAESADREVERIGDKRVNLNLVDGGGPPLVTTVENGKVLAIGDHRGSSFDGRFFGTIDEEQIYGRAIAIYYRSNSSGSNDDSYDSGFVWRKL